MGDISTRFGNNKRREASAHRGILPYVIQEADSRQGIVKEIVLTATDYILGTIPANVIVTKAYLNVTEAYTAATTATVTVNLGATALFTNVDVKTVALTASAITGVLTSAPSNIVAQFAFVGAETGEIGELEVVIEYIDYNRDTGSYVS